MHIPIVDMLNIIKDYSNNDDQLTRKTAIPQYKLLDLVNLVLIGPLLVLFYQQVDGVAMGVPASSTTTEMYMQVHEKPTISMTLYPSKFWERIFHDFYSILKRTHLD